MTEDLSEKTMAERMVTDLEACAPRMTTEEKAQAFDECLMAMREVILRGNYIAENLSIEDFCRMLEEAVKAKRVTVRRSHDLETVTYMFDFTCYQIREGVRFGGEPADEERLRELTSRVAERLDALTETLPNVYREGLILRTWNACTTSEKERVLSKLWVSPTTQKLVKEKVHDQIMAGRRAAEDRNQREAQIKAYKEADDDR